MRLLDMRPKTNAHKNKDSAFKNWTTEEMEASLLWVAFKCKCSIDGCSIPDSDEYQGWYIHELCDLACRNRL